MMLLKSFFRRIIKDFRQKKLMPLKLIFFVQTSTLYILYPYLTIHMRELGINVEETAIMSAITPFVAIIMPPIAGLLADRIGNFKILLSLFSALGGGAALLLLLVPVGRITVQLPQTLILGATCPGSSELTFSINLKHPCDDFLDPQIDATVQSCGYRCTMNELNDTELNAILMSRNYSLDIFEPIASKNITRYYEISESDVPEAMKLPQDAREDRKLKNLEYYKLAIRQLSRSSFFFPAQESQLFDLECNEKVNQSFCGFNSVATSESAAELKLLKMSLKALDVSEHDAFEEQRHYVGRIGNDSSPIKCERGQAANEIVTARVNLPDSEVFLDGCTRTCLVTAPRAQLCSNPKMQIEYNISLTFWAYLCIRVLIGVIGGTSFAMFEGAVIAILREQKADYGLQRIYGSIGGMISSPLSGMLIDYASGIKGYADFRPAFYLYATLKIFSGLLMLMINLEFKAPAKNVVSDVVSVLKNIEVVALLTACFILGTAWGYIESFLFWLLEDLGASRSLMGITITVGGIAGIPLLVLSGPIISRIGHANVLFIGFVFYAIRLLGYSLIYNPWLCLIFESLESVTSSLSFTAAVTYAAKLSSSTTDSSIQGLLGGLYYGVGKGAGSLTGGYLMKAFGTRPTYQIFAVVTLLTGLVYLLFNITYLSKRPQVEGNDIVKKKPKPPKVSMSTVTAGGVEAAMPDNKKSNEISKIQEAEAENSRKEAEFEGETYIIDDLEAVNNAKNLDIAECFNAEAEEEKEEDKQNQRHARENPAFEPDEHDCQSTIVKETSSKKTQQTTD